MIVRRLFVTLVATVLPLSAQQSVNPAQVPGLQAAIRTEPVVPAQAVPVRPATPPAQATPLTPAPVQPAPPAPAGAPSVPAKPSSAPVPAADLQMQPSWETQKLARTYVFTIPAPRGLITDRHGVPLAQTRIGHNLVIQFPTPPKFSDSEANRFIAEQVALATRLIGREIPQNPDDWLKHYKNRAIMPLVVMQDLKPPEIEAIKLARAPGLNLQPVYLRHYPQGMSAAHIVGYVGRQGNFLTSPAENNETLWPDFEGREGLEKTFNEQLTGKSGVLHVSFDAQGRKSAEKITQAPIPGQNVVTTLDLKIQAAVEQSILATKRPGAMVMIDPNTGEILALASIPSYDPNTFVPLVKTEVFNKLRDDPTFPLVPRAYDSAYPPGSTFKVITGLAAMNDGFVDPGDEFEGSPSMEIGGRVFHNHTRNHQGMLAFPQALTVSCNTYFYRVGLKTGPQSILDYSARLGLGRKTGIPLAGEEDGNLMTTEYMLKVHKRRLMPGDVANLSIGQGDLLVTPLQLAHAMGAIGNGGTVFQPRLVLQVQGVDQKISLGYEIRVKDQINIDGNVMKALRDGMVGVVQGRGGTATNAAVKGVRIAAKTGTAQWGAGKNEKVAAWFSGFAPAERPKYAFAAVYEGKEARDDVHGGSHAAPVVARVLRQFLKPEIKDKKGGLRKRKAMEEEEENGEDAAPEEDAPPRARVVKPATEDASEPPAPDEAQ
jgi:penicillin-binding protein 2